MSHITAELTIIIVSYQSYDAIVRHHKQLLESGAFPCLVVDNASQDGSATKLLDTFPDLVVLRQPCNLGYGRAANIGIRHCQTKFALLLNPDVTAPVHQIQRLLAVAKLDVERTAIWGPGISDHNPVEGDLTDELTTVEWLSGCAMLFDVVRISEVGLFDENIFLYSEDTELCERTLRSGFLIRRYNGARFTHTLGKSTQSSPDIEYLRWWHFGWSNSYRRAKAPSRHHLTKTRRKLVGYRIRSWLSISPHKRLKWKAKADGTAAFLAGSAAFDPQGRPMMHPQPS